MVPSSRFVGCIDGIDVYHTSQHCFSPEGSKPNGNYFVQNACVRFLFTSSKVADDERVSEANEWGFCHFEYCELRVSSSFAD